MILKLSKARLEAIKSQRPEGYEEAIKKAAAKEDADAYYLHAMVWGRLTREFGVPNISVPSPSRPVRQASEPPKPVPRSEWPAWAKLIALVAKPEDAGVGDTVERTIGKTNSAAFKTWYLANFGRPCGCAARQTKWNAIYPYSLTQNTQ